MKRMDVLNGQNFFDVAVLASGTISNIFDIALLNDMSITDDISSNSILLPDLENTNKSVKEYYNIKKIKPATSRGIRQGIGYWSVGLNFIVSGDDIPLSRGIGYDRVYKSLKIN